MKKTHLFFGVMIAILFASTNVSAQHDEEDLQNMYIKFLKAEGYLPEVDDDGDIKFKKEGSTYYIFTEEDDLKFFRIVYANIWEIESDSERRDAYEACNHANRLTKVTKAYVTSSDNVWIATETFIAIPEDFRYIFDKSMSAIETATDHFVEKMREL